MRSCLIFAGAPISDLPSVQPDGSYIIAADSGCLTANRIGLTPDVVLGDFDSLGEKPDCAEVITVSAEKDDTDTMLAVKTALERGYNDITIVGGIGGRLDHTYANIQTLAYILKNGGFGRLVGENDTVELLGVGEFFYKRRNGEYLSLFSYGETAVLTTKGTRYNLTEHRLDSAFPLGVSNEIIEDKCSIFVREGQILVIFSKNQHQNSFGE